MALNSIQHPNIRADSAVGARAFLSNVGGFGRSAQLHGQRGELHHSHREGQEDALGSVLNAEVLRDARYIDVATGHHVCPVGESLTNTIPSMLVRWAGSSGE